MQNVQKNSDMRTMPHGILYSCKDTELDRLFDEYDESWPNHQIK